MKDKEEKCIGWKSRNMMMEYVPQLQLKPVNMIKWEALLGESSSEIFVSGFALMKCEKASEEGLETEQRLVRQ